MRMEKWYTGNDSTRAHNGSDDDELASDWRWATNDQDETATATGSH